MILVIFAHPYPDQSRAGQRLLGALGDLEGVVRHSLYDLYPGFDIDVPREQELLLEASAIVLQHPIYWYSVPGLLKHWMDKVLSRGFAYGDRFALEGKRCLWVPTAGGDERAYAPGGVHARPFADFVPPIEQAVRFCRMQWEPPFIVGAAHRVSEAELDRLAVDYRQRVRELDV
jgi:glutathione-regulated potassium-efflux system ancillary protein KefF